MPAQLARRERPYFFMSGSRPVESLWPNRTRLPSQGGEHHPLCPDYLHLLGTDTSHTHILNACGIYITILCQSLWTGAVEQENVDVEGREDGLSNRQLWYEP